MSSAPIYAEPKPPTAAERVAHKFLEDCREQARRAAELKIALQKARDNGQKELAEQTGDLHKIAQCMAYAYEKGADAVLAEGKKIADLEAQERAEASKADAAARAAEKRAPMAVRS